MENIFRFGIVPRDELANQMLLTDVADSDILAYREAHMLTQYVPFHFYARTPFAWVVQKDHCENTFVYIAVKRDYAKKAGYKIIPKHPMSSEQKFHPAVLDYDDGMNVIEWGAMDSRDYADSLSKSSCMAECVSSSVVPIEFLIRTRQVIFFVSDVGDKEELLRIYSSVYPRAVNKPYIIVNESLFYRG